MQSIIAKIILFFALVAGAIGQVAHKVTHFGTISNPTVTTSSTLSGLAGSVFGSPLYVGGSNTSTITGNGTLSTFGGAFNASGTITQNGAAILVSGVATTTFVGTGGTATGPAFTISSSGPLISSIGTTGATLTLTSIATSTILAGYQNTTATFIGTGGTATGPAFTVASSGPLISSIGTTGATVTFTTITTSTILAGYSTSTPSSLAGAYLGVSGNSLTASSTLSSSTINLQIKAPTTTAPSFNAPVWWDFQRLFTNIKCLDLNGTTTLEIYNTTSYSTTTVNSYLTRSLACGISGGTTATFTSSTLLAGYGFIVNVTSTTGSATDTVNVGFTSTKQ